MKEELITDEESFLIQSHALVECLIHLGKMETARNSDFENLKDKIYGQTAKIIKKDNSNASIFQGQGVLLTTFYLLLVIPREMKHKGKLKDSYDMSKAETVAQNRMVNNTSSYKKPKSALTHFRNALSHGRIGWKEGRLTITDEMARGKVTSEFYAEFSMQTLGEIVQELNVAFSMYVKHVIMPRQQNLPQS